MGEGKATILSIPMEHRVKWIRQNYEHFETTEVPRLLEKLQGVGERVGNERVNQWRSLVAEKKWDQFVEEILVHHYDRAYDQASKRSRPSDFDERAVKEKGRSRRRGRVVLGKLRGANVRQSRRRLDGEVR